MKNYFTHPVMLLSYLAGALLVVGGLMAWVIFPDSELMAEGKDLVQTKQYIALGVGVLSIIFALGAAAKGSKGFMIANLVLGIVAAVAVFTAYIPGDDPDAKLLGISGMQTGYYLALVGTVLLFVMSIVGLVKMKKSA